MKDVFDFAFNVFQRLKKHAKNTGVEIFFNHVSKQKAKKIMLCAFKGQHAKCYCHCTIIYFLYGPGFLMFTSEYFHKHLSDGFLCHSS